MSSRARFLCGCGAVSGLKEARDTPVVAAARLGACGTGALALLVAGRGLGPLRLRRSALAFAEKEFGSGGVYFENCCVKPDVQSVVAPGTLAQALVNTVANRVWSSER